MAITYRQLAAEIEKMTENQKDSNLSVYNGDEYYPATGLIFPETDILDENHPVIFAPLTGE